MGGFFDAVVAVGAGEEEELEVVGGVAVGFGFGVKGVAGDDYGCGICDGAALDGDTACVGTVEAEEVGKGLGGFFLNEGQGWGSFVDVDVRIESGKDQFGSETRSIRRCVEFAQKPAVPGID